MLGSAELAALREGFRYTKSVIDISCVFFEQKELGPRDEKKSAAVPLCWGPYPLFQVFTAEERKQNEISNNKHAIGKPPYEPSYIKLRVANLTEEKT
jgi:hypothetical protein